MSIITYISISQTCFGGEEAAVKGGWTDTFFQPSEKSVAPSLQRLIKWGFKFVTNIVLALAYTGGIRVEEHVHDLKKK